MQSFDLILDTPHKNSLVAFFMAIVNVTKQVWLPFEKSDEYVYEICFIFHNHYFKIVLEIDALFHPSQNPHQFRIRPAGLFEIYS